jgi:hypothetical protein
MPETPNFGFEYETPQSKPGITLTGDIDGSAPILAEQVDTALAGIDSRLTGAEVNIATLLAGAPHDTGWLALATTAGTGFTLSAALYRQWGPLVSVYIQYQRSGADLAIGSNGNIIGDPTMCTITTATLRPTQTWFPGYVATATSGGAVMATGGDINLADGNSNSTIANGDLIRVTTTYFVSTFN